MDLLKEKQKQLKELLDDKNKSEDLLDNLKLQKEVLKKEKDEIDSKINTSNEFKNCVASFQNNIKKENKIIKKIITFILVLIIIVINILSKNLFDLIKFPINTYFIILASFVETIAVIDVLILKPNYDYKIKLNANDQMKKYILSNEEETTLYSRIDRIKQENILIEQQINIKYSEPASGLSVKNNGILVPEDFRHEQYLMINENGKRILISGCSHKGILNITQHFKPDILIGGFHFMKIADSEYLTDAANTLLTCPTIFYTCHCTGVEQYEQLKSTMGDILSYLSTGDELILP